jgi:anti-sigma-K factor RskA
MSIPADDDNPDLRYAEYVLGVLDADARAAVEREMAESEAAAGAIELWRRRLLPLSSEIAAREPPPHVWERIRASLQLTTQAGRVPRGEERARWRDSLRFWQWLNLGTAMLLVACVAVLLVSRRPAQVPYMAATLEHANGQVRWTAFMDVERARLIVVPAPSLAFPAGRAPQLWLIAKGHKPVSAGLISPAAAVTLQLDSTMLARLGRTAILAVSVEPPGGSPTGQPTGRVIATGAISAAPRGSRPSSGA